MKTDPRAAEFMHLQEPPKTFPGRVWGCKKWKHCDTRVVETPPYDDNPPSATCSGHWLPMTTKIVERRIAGADKETQS